MQSPPVAFVSALPTNCARFAGLRPSTCPLPSRCRPSTTPIRRPQPGACASSSAAPAATAAATATGGGARKFALISDVHVYDSDIWGVDVTKFGLTRALGLANIMLRRGPGRYSVPVLQAAMGDMRSEGVEHLVCAGDITNLAMECEFSAAQSIFARFGTEDEMTFCPGNHDIYVRSQRDAALYRKYFGKYSRSDVAVESPRGDGFPFLHERNGIAFLGLNSGLPNTAVGSVGARQWAAANELVEKPEAKAMLQRAQFRVIVQHHPAQDPNVREAKLGKQLGHGFRDWRQLAAFSKEHEFDLVVHGHLHVPYRARLANAAGTLVYESGSGTMMSGDAATSARYTVFEVEGKKLVRTYSRVWNTASECFDTNELPVPT